MAKVNLEAKGALVARLQALRTDDALTTAHVKLAAESLRVTERTVWRWLGPLETGSGVRQRGHFTLSGTDREAFAFYSGSIAAVQRARRAVVEGSGQTAGAPVPAFLAEGWATAPPVSERTLYPTSSTAS